MSILLHITASTLVRTGSDQIHSVLLTPTGNSSVDVRLHDNATGSGAGTSITLRTGTLGPSVQWCAADIEDPPKFQNGIYAHVVGTAIVTLEIG